MADINNEKLLEFYKDLFSNKAISEKEVIKKYGKKINDFLKNATRVYTTPAVYRNDLQKYDLNPLYILDKIDKLEDKLAKERQEKRDTTILFAVVIQALVISFQLFKEMFVENFSLPLIPTIILFIIFLAILLVLYELIRIIYKGHLKK